MKTNIHMRIKAFALLLILNVSMINNILGQVPLVFDVENRTPPASCNTAAGNTNTSNTYLPDPFAFTNGGRVATFDDWTCRRNQIKSDIEQYEIGPKPPKPSNVTATYSGGKLTVNVTVNGQTLTLTSNVTMPSGTGPFPVVIGMNAPTGSLSASLFSGVIQIPFNHDQVVSYGAGSGSMNANDPYFKLYPGTNIGKYSAWSWGISRLIDGIELVKSQMNADPKRICVTGCSYAGKMALFGGAFDERVALTIAQESGGGGINSWRMSQAYTTRTGVNVEKIDNTNYSWFKTSMKNLNPNTLPHDHHELVAMIAPRPLLVLGNPTQEWLCDESGYKSCMAAAEVWKAMGVSERFGFIFTPDHNHCSAAQAQNDAVTAFINKYLKNNATANTNIRVNPTKGTKQDLSLTSAINWTAPTITFDTPNQNAPIVTLTSPTASNNLEAPASLLLTASVTDANNNVSKVEFFNGTTKLGEDATVPYSLSLENLAAGTYVFSAKATDKENLTGTSVTVTVVIKSPPFKVQKTSLAPVIDGTPDPGIWDHPNVLAVSGQNVLSGTISSATDLSGNTKFLWDNTYFYFFATVTDNTKQNDSPNPFDDDAVEIYLDVNNDKATTYGANDVQYTFGWNDGTTVGVLPSGRSTSGITYSSVNTATGYVIEGRIPWSTVQASPAEDQLLGVEFMINDDDNGGTRDKKIAWSSTTDNAWQDPSLFGVVKLADEVITSIEEQNSSSGVLCYPNPFNAQFTIVANGTFTYQLMNQMGQVVESDQTKDIASLTTQDLSKGIYLLKVTQDQKSRIVKLVKE
ncbi:MAG: T9SS type A sorting domain-containing protein [Sporocytophaga sp.]|uniref:glucuronyl esterase domain-containing protein n=1 Tax=Sporocytophaga sp. TaxID=2231183 RepID=UPI001AFD19FF|nr:sugar-binding protein [Sporocytophaga sp.]MBO9701927.1 T9SS type A sorting domain-containing protein [Sporocytophaga sp.]